MRKYLLLSIFIFIAINTFSQNRKIEIYCAITVENYNNVEYGRLEKILPDSLVMLHLINPPKKTQSGIGVINFMAFNGWKIITATEAHVLISDTNSRIAYVMKKEIEITEQDSEFIMAQYEKMKR